MSLTPLPPRNSDSPFSNSTEGYEWMAHWCDVCVHDAPSQRDEPGAEPCPLVSISLIGGTPAEWLDGPEPAPGELPRFRDQYHCVMFKREGDDGGGEEPKPIPDPPDQEALFDRGGWERPARMFVQPKMEEARRA